MKTTRSSLWLVAAAAMILAGCSKTDTYRNDRQDIVGGSDTTIAEHPWQISLQNTSGFHFCGGSIIDAEWILTAQHCVDGSSASSMQVVAGTTRLSQAGSGQTRSVAEIIVYPGFTGATSGKDAALLRLSSPLDLSGPSARAIALATQADADAGLTDPAVISTVTGWGTLSAGGSSPDTLQAVDIPLVSNADAETAYRQTIGSDQLAAGILGVGGVDSCQGDSGGPLTVQKGGQAILAGLVSWGSGCADPDFPGIYARVSYFETWVNGTLNATTVSLLDKSNLSASTGTWTHYTVNVPTGALSFSAQMSGGSGDADLYVRYGAQPATNQWDCRPYVVGNNESCSFSSPQSGTWYVSVHAYSTYSGLNLSAGYTTLGSGPSCGDGTCNGTEDCSTCASDCGACAPVCGDGTCNGTEDCSTCAGDCGACAPVCGDGTCNGTEDCSTCSGDCGTCAPACGDGTCDMGEDCSTCSADCGACGPSCGDNVCDGTEDCTTCSADCGACAPFCGDNVCNGTEDCTTCASDCGACASVCGDGTCDAGESCGTCASDCGTCSACPGGELTGTLSDSNRNDYFTYNTSMSGLYAADLTYDQGSLSAKLRLEYWNGSKWRKRREDEQSVSYNSQQSRRFRWRVKHKEGSGDYHLCITSPAQ